MAGFGARPAGSDVRVWWSLLAGLALAKLALHLATGAAYGFHRDELYYLVCGRHLAFGYVDHPPLVPWLAALSEALFGVSMRGLRLFSAVAGAAVVMLAGVLASRLGGGRYAQALAAAGALCCPLFLAANSLFQTVTFDLLIWTVTFLFVVRIVDGGGRRWLILGAVAGVGLLTKYTFAVLVLAVVVGLVVARERHHFRTRWPWLGALVGGVLILPNLLWQVARGWPSLEFVASSAARSRTEPLEFLVNQLLQIGPFAFPLWVGAFFFLFGRRGRPFLSLGWTALFVPCFFLVLRAKAYYPGPVYVLLFAAGAVYLEPRFALPRRGPLARLVGLFPFLLLLGNLAPLPLLVPLLPAQVYAERQDRIDSSDFAERFGWPELVASVAEAWESLQPEVRERTTIFTSNYGSASAIDLFGERYGLPPAASGHNTYWFWTRGTPLDPVIAVGFDRGSLEALWKSVEELGVITNAYGVHNEEYGRPFFLCRGLKERSEDLWPQLRHYD